MIKMGVVVKATAPILFVKDLKQKYNEKRLFYYA